MGLIQGSMMLYIRSPGLVGLVSREGETAEISGVEHRGCEDPERRCLSTRQEEGLTRSQSKSLGHELVACNATKAPHIDAAPGVSQACTC